MYLYESHVVLSLVNDYDTIEYPKGVRGALSLDFRWILSLEIACQWRCDHDIPKAMLVEDLEMQSFKFYYQTVLSI